MRAHCGQDARSPVHMIHTLRDTRPVRASEQLEWARLEEYLRSALPECGNAPMEVEQFPGGHSNLTYLLRFGDRELVLRRPPFGPVPPRAHDMAREFFRWRHVPIFFVKISRLPDSSSTSWSGGVGS